MCLGIFLIYEMNVVARDKLYTKSGAQLHKLFINSFLKRICVVIGILNRRLVALHLKIIVVAKCVLEPFDLPVGLLELPGGYETRYLAAQTRRAHYQPLAMGGKGLLVGTRMVIEAFGMGLRHYLDEIFIALEILGKHHQVTPFVRLVAAVGEWPFGHIHLAAEYRLELQLALILGYLGLHFWTQSLALALGSIFQTLARVLDFTLVFLLYFAHIVSQLLDAKHVAMVGQSEARHIEGHGLVDKTRHRSLSVKQRILAVDMKMYKWWCHGFKVTHYSPNILPKIC